MDECFRFSLALQDGPVSSRLLKLQSHRAPGPPRTVPDPIRGYPWIDPSCIRSAAVMVLGGPGWSWKGPGWSWKVLDGPAKSGRSFLKF